MIAVASISLPAIQSDPDDFFRLNLSQAVRGLVGLVLLFNIHAVYQQILIKRLRRKLAEEMIVQAGLRTRADELESVAMLDPSTGLYNARYIDRRLALEIARSKRYGEPLTIVLLEIEGFTRIAELLGQSAARKVLRDFAFLLSEAVSVADVTISLGGGEFMLLLPECTVEDVPRLLNHVVSSEVDLSGNKGVIPFLIRSATYQPGELQEELLRRLENLTATKSSALLHLMATGPHATG
jgi:diguanylate cyclase (GGDEF)-like protein